MINLNGLNTQWYDDAFTDEDIQVNPSYNPITTAYVTNLCYLLRMQQALPGFEGSEDSVGCLYLQYLLKVINTFRPLP